MQHMIPFRVKNHREYSSRVLSNSCLAAQSSRFLGGLRMRINIGWCVILGVVLSAAMPMLAAGSDDGYALVIQQSPPDGGVVNPGSGVHRAPIGEVVSLSAVPKPGYRFMYWLGDVKNSVALDTTISVDSPKMVVAVFSREDHEEPLPGIGIVDGVAGGGGQRYTANPIQPAGSVSPGGGGGDIDYPDFPPFNPPDDDFPVPDPATLLLMGLGGVAVLKRK